MCANRDRDEEIFATGRELATDQRAAHLAEGVAKTRTCVGGSRECSRRAAISI